MSEVAFADGARVRIVDLGKPGHVRTPQYVRGKVGVIERFGGTYENPEDRAYGRGRGTAVQLFRVRLRQRDIWPDYPGCEADTLEIEIYEHWLRPEPTGEAQ
ncbi:SH3-like domain-containing protein [Arenibacterium halophilum]|uniref:Nitrile hydratase subunit beta n=1 Tax=Arenibacterium halophilum TaxID=2583821 RepID=A0ABY2WZB1_9RHOB|nr:SH3-like domain-containing protein [Arenibacterium halophilum]TMV08288.1 nitrile hydratase subunit beta [Arenibacterium halophilum]